MSALMFGGFGLWERYYVLDQPLFAGAGWDSTARFHVWPWPYKFAAVTNFPAFLAGGLVSWPLSERWPSVPEPAQAALCLPFVVLLWFAIGGWFDRRWGWMDGPPMPKLPWVLLLLFTLLCAGGRVGLHQFELRLPAFRCTDLDNRQSRLRGFKALPQLTLSCCLDSLLNSALPAVNAL